MIEWGFDVVGPDGELTDLDYLARPVAVSDSRNNQYSVAVYPRLAGLDEVSGHVGPDSLWKEDEKCWLVKPTVVGSNNTAVPWCWVDPRIDISGAPDVATGKPMLAYDGTIDGLRGVPVVDLDTVKSDVATSMLNVGIKSTYDLIHSIPRRYIDLSNPMSINEAPVGETVAVVGTITQITKPRERGGMMKVTIVDDQNTKMWVTWFKTNYGLVKRVSKGGRMLFYGKMEEFTTASGWSGRSMTFPLTESLDGNQSNGFIGIYPASGKHDLTTWQMYNAANEAAQRLGDMIDPIPEAYTTGRGMPNRADAFRMVHAPHTAEEAVAGRNRLAYDELLRLQLALMVARTAQYNESGISHPVDRHLIDQFLGSLPYPLTGAQVRSINEVIADLCSPHAMNRLLQGDVGSGKTNVTIAAMLAAVEGGSQAAMVAPTEILANQHYEEVIERLSGIRHRDGRELTGALLTNKVTGKAKKAVLAGLADGSIDIVVGTQALLQDSIEFKNLGLAIVDEQHRFGVEQRNALKSKGAGGKLPDVLYATATPIPRSAVMTIFGDLDVSILDEMPPGRTPIETHHVVEANLYDENNVVWESIRQQVYEGRQAFVVCPLVASSQTKEAAAAENTAHDLAEGALKGLRIGVVTGKQKADERSEIMGRFERGELDVLVATTVIEVGVNVPNSTVIAILGADKFGIAQLHQLRGRVGRGKWAGTCFLVADPRTKNGEQRMEALVSSTDGFVLSEMDLQIRGTGQLLGSSQSGAARDLRVANILEDTELVEFAKKDAAEIVQADPRLLRRPQLRNEITLALGEDAATWLTNA